MNLGIAGGLTRAFIAPPTASLFLLAAFVLGIHGKKPRASDKST